MNREQIIARIKEMEVETRGRMLTKEEDAEFVNLYQRLQLVEIMDLDTWTETVTITGQDQ